jgi:glycosyltransferase involved in cell wall biosynthesis
VPEQPVLSIVITSYTMDRLKDIRELLDSIKAQTYPDTETIIVIERTTELLGHINQYIVEQSIPRTKSMFNEGECGLSAARNLGIKETTGEIVAFVDDDALPCPDWADEIIQTYRDNTVIGATGPSFPKWESKTIDWVPEEFYWLIGGSIFNACTEIREVRNVSGTNMSFRREAFDLCGFFSTQLGAKGGGESGKHELVGEETEFSMRVSSITGKHILYNPNVKVQHRVYKFRVTPSFVARRAYWEGYTKALFKKSCHDARDNNKVLKVEYQLLGRIATRLLPSILLGLFCHTTIALRRLSITVNATFFVAVGYLHYSLRSLTGHAQTVVYEEKGFKREAG